MHLKRALFAVVLTASCWPVSAMAQGMLSVQVSGVKDSQGTVVVQVCPEAQFLKRCRIVGSAPAHAGTTTVVLQNVPAGRYAALAYHDRNANGRADRNMLGLPTEDVGFSNGALKGMSKPKFADAAFDHGSQDKRITFSLRHF